MAHFDDQAELPVARAAELAEQLRDQDMLYEVVAWMATQRPAPEIVRIVDQDEYTNDVVVELADTWLVYDCS